MHGRTPQAGNEYTADITLTAGGSSHAGVPRFTLVSQRPAGGFSLRTEDVKFDMLVDRQSAYPTFEWLSNGDSVFKVADEGSAARVTMQQLSCSK